MSLGEKIKEARLKAGLTQEQLSAYLLVSRQAITKWESNKGMPDVENLKRLSKVLNISIDFLLDDQEQISMNVLREPIDLTKYKQKFSFYHRTGKTGWKDRLLREKYPDAEIYGLQAEQIETKEERMIDEVLFWTTSSPGGLTTLINQCKNKDKEFYLVKDEEKQYLVLITEEFVETTRLAYPITNKKFSVGSFNFKIGYPLKK